MPFGWNGFWFIIAAVIAILFAVVLTSRMAKRKRKSQAELFEEFVPPEAEPVEVEQPETAGTVIRFDGFTEPKVSEAVGGQTAGEEKNIAIAILSDEASPEAQKPAPKVTIDAEQNEIILLALSRIQGVGFYTLKNLYNKYQGDLEKVWRLEPDELADTLRVMKTPKPVEVVRKIQNEKDYLFDSAASSVRFLRNRNTSLIFRHTPDYPKGLDRLKDPPAWLFVHGDASLLRDEKIVAVVGTRVPTDTGIETARRVSKELIKEQCIILSGLAEGIDEASHQTAVDHGAPTIAVLGHGLEVTFPAKTAGLRKEIVETGGAVISEYLMSDSYARERFVQRNRIQAALSGAVAIIEAKSKSGTAHTVKYAKAVDVTLFGAVIGEIQNSGPHEILRDLKEAGNFVFNIESDIGQEQFRTYIKKLFAKANTSQRRFERRIFSGVLERIRMVAQDYNPSEEDYDWLIAKINENKPKPNAH